MCKKSNVNGVGGCGSLAISNASLPTSAVTVELNQPNRLSRLVRLRVFPGTVNTICLTDLFWATSIICLVFGCVAAPIVSLFHILSDPTYRLNLKEASYGY